MAHARARGYPVPEVHDVEGDSLVMDRIDGLTMLEDLGRRPWLLRRHARTLAQLHDRLHAIPSHPGALAAPVQGDRLVHLDLHPANIMLSEEGPVVIDWSNARAGDPAADLACTWVVMATSDIPAGPAVARLLGAGRALFLRFFLGGVDVDAARRALPALGAYRLADANVLPSERPRVERLVAKEGRT